MLARQCLSLEKGIEQWFSVFFLANLDEIDIDDMYFQQDGATCLPIALLHKKLPDRVIFRNGDVNWPSNACDLTPFVFFSLRVF